MSAILACTDLFFASRILETARLRGVAATQVRSEEATLAAIDEASVLFVDLDDGAFDPTALIAAARARRGDLSIVAFVRHDAVERIRAAREAGASRVLARGAFSASLPDLLA